jgi:hypothetical protein
MSHPCNVQGWGAGSQTGSVRRNCMDTDSPAQAQERHERFIRSTVSQRAAWALKNDVGLATWSDDEAESGIVPLWSDRESAVVCAAASFQGYSPESFDLEFLMVTLLPELEKNGLWVSTNPTAQMTGVDVPAERLREEITHKLAEPGASGNSRPAA